jgi:hypothetical protein
LNRVDLHGESFSNRVQALKRSEEESAVSCGR